MKRLLVSKARYEQKIKQAELLDKKCNIKVKKHKCKFHPTNETQKEYKLDKGKIWLFDTIDEIYILRKWVCICGETKWVREK